MLLLQSAYYFNNWATLQGCVNTMKSGVDTDSMIVCPQYCDEISSSWVTRHGLHGVKPFQTRQHYAFSKPEIGKRDM